MNELENDDLQGWCCPLGLATKGKQHKMGCYVRFSEWDHYMRTVGDDYADTPIGDPEEDEQC